MKKCPVFYQIFINSFFFNFTHPTFFHKNYFENFSVRIRKFQFDNFIFHHVHALAQRCPTKMILVATFATFVATKSLLSPQFRELRNKTGIQYTTLLQSSFWRNFRSPHLNVQSPHMANGDRVRHRCFSPYTIIKNWNAIRLLVGFITF